MGTADAAIIVVYLLGAVLFGVWVGRGQESISGYLVGGRSLPWWAVLFSIVATETSTVTFLSIPGLAFNPEGGSFVFLQLALGYIVGRLLIVVLFLPQYFRGELFTAYEVLHRRFGGATKQTASALFILTRTLADGLRLYLTAIVLQFVLGLDLWVSVVAVGATTIVYTWLGGMKSVVWNDCVQFAIYIAGAVVALAVILADLGGAWSGPGEFFANLPGGWARLADFAAAHDKFRVLDFTFDLGRPYTIWAGVLGGIFVALASHGTDQLMVQRYLSARTRKEASWALGLSGPVVCAQFALFLLIGVGLACFYQTFQPQAHFDSNDQVFPAFIVAHLPTGVRGLVVAAVFAAAMSTLSGSLNCSAGAALNDFYLPWRKEKPSPEHLLRVSRALTVAFGLGQMAVGIAGQGLAMSVIEAAMAVALFTTGVILGVFFLGVLAPGVSQRGALLGLVAGLAVMAGLVLALPAITGSRVLAWPWYALVGSLATFVTGLCASQVTAAARRGDSQE